ncbi:MAG: T9SS type A sorting domain-containing protein [Flavobacteriia bacterium]|nr:T9SS type A sorting domain-containing protein [Flavobacteriia bacterium]
MKKFILLLILFSFHIFSFEQTTIDSYEYWVDQYQNVQQVNVTPSNSLHLNTQIDLSSFEKGFHTFYLRFKDNQDKYSSTVSHLYYSKSGSANIIAFEYWFDMDFSNKIFTSISPSTALNLNQSFDCTNLSNGMHIVHVRFLNEGNEWSSVSSQFFNKKSNGNTESVNQIVNYEYWFDEDYSNKIVGTTPTESNLNFISSLDCSFIPNGVHRFHIRFQDNAGQWSSVLSQFINKNHNGSSMINLITSYRYWLDNNWSEAITVSLPSPQNPYELINDFDLTQVSKGEHFINIQFRDTSGLWSSVLTDTIIKNPLPIADFSLTTTAYCDSTVISFYNNSVDADTYFWDFGDGTNSTDSIPNKTYTIPGIYTISLFVTELSSGLDSLITQTIEIYGYTTNSISESACDMYVSPSGNYVWTQNGVYVDTLESQNGCDSLLSINLTIHQSTSSTIIETACDNYTAPDGQVYTQSGIYSAIIPNSNQCDSVITIDLTINQSTNSSIVETSCGDYIAPDGQVFTQSGIYSINIQNSNGCDSLITIDLTVKQNSSSEITEESCGSYIAPDGQLIETSGDYLITIPNEQGCDSLITVHLTVNQVNIGVIQNGEIFTALADGANYQWIDCENGMTEISGENSQFFTATQNGQYAVIVTVDQCSDTSICYVLDNIGINENLDKQITVFPNPTDEWVTIQTNFENNYSLQIIDYQGKVVLSLEDTPTNHKLNVSAFSSGIYIIRMKTNNHLIYRKLNKL